MPVEIIGNPREHANDADCVVCHRVEDFPIPRRESKIEHCRDCGSRIWVASSSPIKPPRLCYPCAKKFCGGQEPMLLVSRSTALNAALGGNPETCQAIERFFDDGEAMNTAPEIIGAFLIIATICVAHNIADWIVRIPQ